MSWDSVPIAGGGLSQEGLHTGIDVTVRDIHPGRASTNIMGLRTLSLTEQKARVLLDEYLHRLTAGLDVLTPLSPILEELFVLPSLFGRLLTRWHWPDNWLTLADAGLYNPTLAGYWLVSIGIG